MGKKKIMIVCNDSFYSSRDEKNLIKSGNLLKEMILQSTEKGKSVIDIANGEFECECVDDIEFTHYTNRDELYKIIYLGNPSTIIGGEFSNCEKCVDFERAFKKNEFSKSNSEYIDFGWSGNCAYIKSINSLSKELFDEYDDDIEQLSKLLTYHYKEVRKCIEENNFLIDENLVVDKEFKVKSKKSKHLLRRSVMGGLALAAPPMALTFLFAEGFNSLITDNIVKKSRRKSDARKFLNAIFELRVLYFYLSGLSDFLFKSEKTVDNSNYNSTENIQELLDEHRLKS